MKKQFAYFVLSLLAISLIFIITANINQEVGGDADITYLTSNGGRL